MNKRIVVLAVDSSTTRMLVAALGIDHTVVRVVLEDKESTALFVRRRAKRMGWWTVIGQLLFSVIVVKIQNVLAGGRVREIHAQYGLADTPIDPVKVVQVRSVNDPSAIALLQKEQPDVIVLSGTRIVSATVLGSVEVPFLNIHAGITPM